MKTYIVLFRGVNIGGKNLLPMKELVVLFENNGFKNVKTYIQTGNVVLEGSKVSSTEIATLISGKYGFKPEVIVLDKSEFISSIKYNPFHPTEGKLAHFYFCSKEPELSSEKLVKYLGASEEYKLKNKVFYLFAPDGIGRSKLVTNIEACLGVPVTGRNLNTINKLSEMVKNA